MKCLLNLVNTGVILGSQKYNVRWLSRRAVYKLYHCTIIGRIDSEKVRRPHKEIQQDF